MFFLYSLPVVYAFHTLLKLRYLTLSFEYLAVKFNKKLYQIIVLIRIFHIITNI